MANTSELKSLENAAAVAKFQISDTQFSVVSAISSTASKIESRCRGLIERNEYSFSEVYPGLISQVRDKCLFDLKYAGLSYDFRK